MTKELTAAVCAFDMASLRVRVQEHALGIEVCAATGEELVSFTSELTGGALVLEAFDQVLATATVLRRDETGEVVKCKVALLNPFTMEIAIEALPRTKSYELPRDVPVPLSGLVLTVSNSSCSMAGRQLEPVALKRDGLVRCAVLHTA
jgi:hypothetical protein